MTKLIRPISIAIAAAVAATSVPLLAVTATASTHAENDGLNAQLRAGVKTKYYKSTEYPGSFSIIQTKGTKFKLLVGTYKHEFYPGQEACVIGRRSTANPNIVRGRYANLDADGYGPTVQTAALRLSSSGKRLAIGITTGSGWANTWAYKRVSSKKMRKKLRNQWTPTTGTRSPAHCLRGVPR